MTGCDEEKIVASGPSHRSQCGELTDSHAITMHTSQAAMRVVALTAGFILESYFAGHSGGAQSIV
jgi:ethanolamine utilization protein EutA (predicted chaperonin)